MAGVMPIRDPEWFCPVRFCQHVLNFASNELHEEEQGITRLQPAAYRDAVEVVGKAVFTLQAIIGGRMRSLLLDSMRFLAGIGHHDTIYEEIFEFMSQGYLKKDIFNTTLTCFAILGEVLMFLEEFGLPVPSYWHHMPWVNIYQNRLRNELSAKGGWEELVERARRRYIDSGLFLQVRHFYRQHLPIPHAEVFVGDHPPNPVEFVHELFPVVPRSSELAMALIRILYSSQPYMVPSEEEIQLYLM